MIRLVARNLVLWSACLAMVLFAFALSAMLYPSLPDPVPTHWGFSGEADGFTPKPWGAFILPLILLGVLALLFALPGLSPEAFRLDEESIGYRWAVAATVMLLVGIHAIALGAAVGATSPPRAFPVLIGVFFVVLGNVLPKVRRNFYIGIRTPWTLADEEVWSRTHRWGGRAMVLGGIVVIALGGAGGPFSWSMAVLLAAILAPVVYSFLAYRALHPVR